MSTPAFPSTNGLATASGVVTQGHPGMSLREYSAIKLCVPDSGTDWLDDMIRKSLRDELAAKAMQGWVANPTSSSGLPETATPQDLAAIAAAWAYLAADAMLEQRGAA